MKTCLFAYGESFRVYVYICSTKEKSFDNALCEKGYEFINEDQGEQHRFTMVTTLSTASKLNKLIKQFT